MAPIFPKLLQILACTVSVRGQAAPGEGFGDLPCNNGKTSQTWLGVKKNFRGLFENGGAFSGVSKERLGSTLDAAMKELNAAEALTPQLQSECSAGKLSLQMLSINTLTDPVALAQLHSSLETLSSPTLTMLLDVPFVAIAEAGWPIFGFLAQLNWNRRQTEFANTPEADGLTTDVGGAFYAELTRALLSGNIKEMEELSLIYFNLRETGNTLASLTALAAQAAVQSNLQRRFQLLETLQSAFKQAIGSAAELDYALGTQWPLWGLLHEAVDGLAAPLQATK